MLCNQGTYLPTYQPTYLPVYLGTSHGEGIVKEYLEEKMLRLKQQTNHQHNSEKVEKKKPPFVR